MDGGFSLFSSSSMFIDSIVAVFGYVPKVAEVIKNLMGALIGLSLGLSTFFFIGIIYCVEKLKVIRVKEEQKYDVKVEPAFKDIPPEQLAVIHRWENAEKHINSTNPNDWKQAIIDCDIILDDLLSKMGYRGESVGEKLKRVVKGDMKTLDDAWEAHKIRNQIAHEPGFSLDHHIAKKTFHHYRKVFDEFYII